MVHPLICSRLLLPVPWSILKRDLIFVTIASLARILPLLVEYHWVGTTTKPSRSHTIYFGTSRTSFTLQLVRLLGEGSG